MLHLRFDWVISSLQFNPVLGKDTPRASSGLLTSRTAVTLKKSTTDNSNAVNRL